MAVETLELSALSLESLPSAFGLISKAINDRMTVIKGTGNNPRYPLQNLINNVWVPEKGSPNFANQVNNITLTLKNLAQYFVDLDAEYISNAYTDFPKMLSGAWNAAAPEVGTVDVTNGETFTEETMDHFKSILKNAGEWLNRMVYIVPKTTYTTQRWRETKSWYSSDESSLSNKTAPFTVPEINERTGPMQILVRESQSRINFNGALIADDGSRRVECDTGLIVDNRTPYDANVKNYLVLPFVNESNWSAKDKWQNYHRSIRLCDKIWTTDSGYVFPGASIVKENDMAYIGGDWKVLKTYRKNVEYDKGQTWSGSNFQISASSDLSTYNYTYEGEQSILLDSEHTEEGENQRNYWYADPENSITVVGSDFWYGFGNWSTIDQPYETSIAAHTRTYVLPPLREIPKPTVDWHQFDGDYTQGGYDWREEHTFEYTLRVVPVLDFSESITTFRIWE